MEVSYPLAANILPFEHTYQPGFNKHLPEFKSCVNAFEVASQACGGRDLVEEYLAAGVWPLTSGWFPVPTRRVKFGCLDCEIASPVLGLTKPEGKSDEVIVAELEMRASELLGPWNKKEYDSFIAVCCHQGHVNRCLHEMGVSYDARVVPSVPQRRPRAPGNVGSEPLVRKPKGKAYAEVATTSAKTSQNKTAKNLIAKQSVIQAEAWKRKAVDGNCSQADHGEDLGMPLFMEKLRRTEGSGPLVVDGKRWSMRYNLNQFGTMDAGFSGVRVSVAQAMVRLQHQEPKRRRIGSVVDDDESSEEGDEVLSRAKVSSPLIEDPSKEDVEQKTLAVGVDAETVSKAVEHSAAREVSTHEASDTNNVDPSGKVLFFFGFAYCCLGKSLLSFHPVAVAQVMLELGKVIQPGPGSYGEPGCSKRWLPRPMLLAKVRMSRSKIFNFRM